MIYKEEECKNVFLQPIKIYCYICGKYTGFVETYPRALLIKHKNIICRSGYGCQSKCKCGKPDINKKEYRRIFNGRIYKCQKCEGWTNLIFFLYDSV